MLTDTVFWVDLFRERARGEIGPARSFIRTNRLQEFSVSIITWGELAAGVEHWNEMDHLLRRIHVHPLAKHVAWQASRIERELTGTGGRLGENDNWIAATALSFGLRLVTRDAAFHRVPRLRIVAY